MIRVGNIKLSLDEDEKVLRKKIARALQIGEKDIESYLLVKEAIDARKKEAIKKVYTVDVKTAKEEELLKKNPTLKSQQEPYHYVEKGNERLSHRPIVVGTGPCGIFAALILAQMGYKPLILERGKCVEERVKDVQAFWEDGKFNPISNVQFGEGGAGTFSDGKLTTQIKNKRCQKVLEEFVAAGAPDQILYKSKPHIGTDILREVVKKMRTQIEELGGEFRFETALTSIKVEQNQLVGIEVNGKEWLEAQVCILAIGHSARDTLEMLYEKDLYMEQKPFSIGMRIEHLQEWINTDQYGDYAEHPALGAAEYKLVHHAQNGRTVYSFCMCPGGYVIASSSEEGRLVTNGMSEFKRDGINANSALLVNVGPKDYLNEHPLAGMYLQRTFEELAYDLGGKTYKAPVQKVGDFLGNRVTTEWGIVKPTYTPDVTLSNIRAKIPEFMGEAIEEALSAFGKKIKHFDHEDALLTGFETRSSSPVRMPRDSAYESNIKGLYPAGEGAGYAGGITSAAVDGIEAAEAIVSKYVLKTNT